MNFSGLDWGIILLVPLIALFLQRALTPQDGWRGYFLATQATTPFRATATYFGANLTFTSIFLILSEKAYELGLVVVCIPIFWILGTVLFVQLYPRIEQHVAKGVLLHQMLGTVFQSHNLQKVAAGWTIVAFLGTIALEFYGGAKLLQWLDVPLLNSKILVFAFATLTLLLTMQGGFRGVAISDIFLDVVILVGLGVMTFYLLAPDSGSGLFEFNLHGLRQGNSTESAAFMLGMAILFLPFQFCTLDSWQRLGAWATRKKSPKRDLTVAAIILGIAYCVPIAIGLWAYGAVGDKIGGDQPLRFFLERNNIPTVLIGIVFAGFLAAIISTADELLNCCSYSWMIDLLGVEKPPSGSAEEIKFIASGRLYTGILGMAAALTSIGAIWLEKNISELAIAVFSAQVVFIIPVSIALFAESKADEFAVEAIWATIIGYLVSILCVIIGWNWHSQPLADGAPVIGFLVAFIVFIPRGLFFLHRLLRRTFRRFQCIIRRLGRN